METTKETVPHLLEDVCVKDEFDFATNSVSLCENLDSNCFIKMETDDLCDLNDDNKNFVGDLNGSVQNDMCLKQVKSNIDDLKEEFTYESSCSADSYESSYIVKSERKLPNNLPDLENCKQSATEQCPNAANGITVLFCDACNFFTKYRGNLVKHIKRKHNAGHNFKMPKHSYRIACYYCQFRTDNRNKMTRHIFRVHVFNLPEGEFDKVKPCYMCKYESANRMEFLTHFIINHLDGLKPKSKEAKGPLCTCELCNYSTHWKRHLKQHIEAVHQKLRRFRCHLCDYGTYYSAALRIHLLATHEKIKPFKCGLCKYSSSYAKHLRRHVRTQHEMKKKRKPHVRRCHTQKID